MVSSGYLASKYLSADSKPSKKRKRKDPTGLTLDEDDTAIKTSQPGDNSSEDDNAPTVVGSKLSAGLNKASKNPKWIKVGSAAPSNSDQAAADAILADAAAEQQKLAAEDDEAPAIVDAGGKETEEGPTMQNGAMAGLQSAEQVTKALKRKEKEERRKMKEAGMDNVGKAQETIYRDASGRILNVEKMKAEAKGREEEEKRKKAEEVEAAKGDVQRREKETRRQDLAEAKILPFARGKDDVKMNEDLKEVERWNDPMAKMLGTKTGKGKAKKGSSGGGGRTYQGPSEPNRYGIKPGWRWDGVDRSNGFERKWFASRNAKQDRENLEYMWQMDE